MPKSLEKLKDTIASFDENGSFLVVMEQLCHLTINCPKVGLESAKEYHQFKNFYSIVIMVAIVDAKYRSMWARSGYSGNNHDAIIFQSTDQFCKTVVLYSSLYFLRSLRYKLKQIYINFR